MVPAPRAQLVPARTRLEPAVRRVQGGAAQRTLLLLRERGRGRPTSRLVRRRSLRGNGIRGRRAVRFRSRSRRRRRRLRARGTRRRDVAHRGNRRKGHPTISPRARRVATASTLSAAGPRTRRAVARLPSPRSRGPASQSLARSLARGSACAARCLGRVAHRNPRPGNVKPAPPNSAREREARIATAERLLIKHETSSLSLRHSTFELSRKKYSRTLLCLSTRYRHL